VINRAKIDLAVGFFVAIGILALVFLALKVGNLVNFSMSEGYRIIASKHGSTILAVSKFGRPLKVPVSSLAVSKQSDWIRRRMKL